MQQSLQDVRELEGVSRAHQLMSTLHCWGQGLLILMPTDGDRWRASPHFHLLELSTQCMGMACILILSCEALRVVVYPSSTAG